MYLKYISLSEGSQPQKDICYNLYDSLEKTK